jgi:hypothetical protein
VLRSAPPIAGSIIGAIAPTTGVARDDPATQVHGLPPRFQLSCTHATLSSIVHILVDDTYVSVLGECAGPRDLSTEGRGVSGGWPSSPVCPTVVEG